MPLAYAQSLGDGATRVFSVPFPYISKTHVQVRVEGAIVPFSWLSETSIQLATAPAVNAVVDRRRVTPRDTLLVDFVDGSTLVESDLDLSALQVFYLAQEAFDLGEASLGVTEDGSFSALNRRISNVLNPVNPQDVATKNFVETGVTSQVAIATQKANEAANSAGQSEASATSSAQQAAAALASKNAAAGSATAAAQSEANALANKNQTQLDRAATAADRVQTGLDRDAAKSSADAAAKSARDAALFDPSSYLLKTADAVISKAAPALSLLDTGLSATWRIQHGGDGSLRLDHFNSVGTQTNTHTFKPTGEFWTSQIGDLKTALDGKLPTSGGKLSDTLSIERKVDDFWSGAIFRNSGAGDIAMQFVSNGRAVTDATRSEIGQRKNGTTFVWTAGKEWGFNGGGNLTLPSGGILYPNGDVYHAGYGVPLTGLTDRARKVRLGAETFQSVNTNGWNIVPGGGAITALYRGGNGQIEGMNYRMLQQTGLDGNWYNVGTA